MARPLACSLTACLLLLGGCPHGDDGPPVASTDASSTGSCDGSDCGLTTVSNTTGEVDEGTLDTTAASDDPAAGDTAADACAASADCSPDFCVAPFDPTLGVFGRGPFECVSECVDLQDELRWCADATACCASDAMCTERGYCELPGGTDSTGDSGDTGADSTTTGGDTGTGGSGTSTSGSSG